MNKQIFQSRLVLASPEAATDGDYAAILGVVGHEVHTFVHVVDFSFSLNWVYITACYFCSISTIGLVTGNYLHDITRIYNVFLNVFNSLYIDSSFSLFFLLECQLVLFVIHHSHD